MNHDWAVAIVFSVVSLSAGAAIVLRGPVGKALAQWIASWSTPEHKALEAQVAVAYAPKRKGADSAELGELRAEVDDLHRQLGEVQERLDFAERLLTKQREAERLGPPRA